MLKKYAIGSFCALLFLLSVNTSAQTSFTNTPKHKDSKDLLIYPNPVNITNPYIHITSASNEDKHVVIYNVLGKKELELILRNNKLNISRLVRGVYILKVEEAGRFETRKLIIK